MPCGLRLFGGLVAANEEDEAKYKISIYHLIKIKKSQTIIVWLLRIVF
jgi:hypothetical protein